VLTYFIDKEAEMQGDYELQSKLTEWESQRGELPRQSWPRSDMCSKQQPHTPRFLPRQYAEPKPLPMVWEIQNHNAFSFLFLLSYRTPTSLVIVTHQDPGGFQKITKSDPGLHPWAPNRGSCVVPQSACVCTV
jgi:hypothetical protein